MDVLRCKRLLASSALQNIPLHDVDVLRCGRLLSSSALQNIPLHDVDVLRCRRLLASSALQNIPLHDVDVLRCGRLLASSALQNIPLHDADVLWCASLWMRFPCFLWSVVWPVDCELWPHYVWTLDMYFDSSHIVMDYLKILILCSCRFSINLRIKYIPTASRLNHVTSFFLKLIFSLR